LVSHALLNLLEVQQLVSLALLIALLNSSKDIRRMTNGIGLGEDLDVGVGAATPVRSFGVRPPRHLLFFFKG